MNLKQLIASREKVVSSRWDTHKSFEDKPMGNIISIDLQGAYHNRNKTLSVTLEIKAATQEYETIRPSSSSLGKYYDKSEKKRDKRARKKEPISSQATKIETHTCTIAFKGIEQLKVDLEKSIDLYKAKCIERGKPSQVDAFKKKKIKKIEKESGLKYIGTEDNLAIFRTPVSLLTPVNVRCTCANFFYAFATYNGINDCLIGTKPGVYTKYEDDKLRIRTETLSKQGSLRRKVIMNTNRNKDVPILNENQVPGLCKHLQLLIAILIEKNQEPKGDLEKSFDIVRLSTNNFNDTFIKKINPKDYIREKLSDYKKISKLIKEDDSITAKKEFKNFMKNLKDKVSSVKKNIQIKRNNSR